MSIIIQKFGGTSVADSNKILAAARKAIRAQKEGHQVVMVVSAMGKHTDELVRLAKQIDDDPPDREMDMLLSTGEQVSVALMAMAIQAQGFKAVSMTGAQIGIKTDNSHTKARIISISTERLHEALNAGNIVIAAGFQGVDDNFNITTLGRGGSDTTAVALAAVLGAESCEIYTDVDGVYTTDPRIVPEARRVHQISYDEMLEMASLGAGVMHSRSIEFAKNYSVPVHVRASYSDAPGTMIVSDPESFQRPVCGAAVAKDEVRITVRNVPDKPGAANVIFQSIAAKKIVMDMIVQNIAQAGFTDISFTIPKHEMPATIKALEEIKQNDAEAYESFNSDDHLSKVSVVGLGMAHQPGVAQSMFRSLSEHDINIQMISTSEIKISVLVSQDQAIKALRAVHETFELDKEPADIPALTGVPKPSETDKVDMINRMGMEDLLLQDIQLDETQSSITLRNLPDIPGLAATLFQHVGAAGYLVDMIVQSQGRDGRASLTFTVPREDTHEVFELIQTVAHELGCDVPQVCHEVAKLSLIGTGMRSHTTVASRMLGTLAKNGMNVEMINTSEIRFNVVISSEFGTQALLALREEFRDSLI